MFPLPTTLPTNIVVEYPREYKTAGSDMPAVQGIFAIEIYPVTTTLWAGLWVLLHQDSRTVHRVRRSAANAVKCIYTLGGLFPSIICIIADPFTGLGRARGRPNIPI